MVVQRGCLQHISYEKFDMEIDDKYCIDHKLDYLKLNLKISKLRYHGVEVSKELLQQAHELGHLAGISDEELKNL